MRQIVLIIIGVLLIPVALYVIVVNAPKCIEGHYETRTRERCQTKPQLVMTMNKGYQYAYITDCNGYEEYQAYICTKYESR